LTISLQAVGLLLAEPSVYVCILLRGVAQRSTQLTNRQQLVLNFVNEVVRETGAPPTVREVMDRCDLSPRGAHLQLKALVKCGLLVHERGKQRGYRPKVDRPPSSVPILGRVPAGHPADQPEDHDGTLPLPWGVSDGAFALRVDGPSMRDGHILDGDIIVIDTKRDVKDGDVVLASIDGQQTVKRFRKRGKKWVLEPANPDFGTIEPKIEGDRVVGRVVALVRKVG
jgi:repressor LexA